LLRGGVHCIPNGWFGYAIFWLEFCHVRDRSISPHRLQNLQEVRMAEIFHESLMTLSEAARALPGRRQGKHAHPSTLYRWAVRGIRGQRLEVVRIGGTVYTSRQALERFAERLTAAPGGFPPTTPSRNPAIEAVEGTLDCLGL
jgi:hypothetical protein